MITPLNSFLYNMKSENLAEHGLHPHYTHLLVNLPLLLGPLPLFLLFPSLARNEKEERKPKPKYLLYFIILSGLVFLSLAPHQEPRFLLPLFLPIVILSSLVLPKLSHSWRTHFWMIWILFNVVMVVLFGVFHQAGVVPSLHTLRENAEENDAIVYWHTFMPPIHLLALKKGRGPVVFDLAGADSESLLSKLKGLEEEGRWKTIFLIAPSPAKIERYLRGRVEILEEYPHIGTEHLEEFFEDWEEREEFHPFLSVYKLQ